MRREKSYAGITTVIVLLLLIGVAFFIYNSKYFERNAPKIVVKNEIYWNMQKPIDIVLKDDSGIKFAQATLSDGKNSFVAASIIYNSPKKTVHLLIKPPKNSFMYKKEHFTLNVQTVDTSKWHFFSGNKAIKKIDITVDRKRPTLYIVNNSYGIRKGGSALVIFKANDKNMESLYIQTYGKRFYPTPFYKKGYYISLIAWPIKEKKFRADIIAIDKAGNSSRAHIPLYFKSSHYRKSTIKLSDKILNGKVADFIEQVAPELSKETPIKKFIYINEKERKKDEDLIHKVTTPTDSSLIKNFYLKPFHPLKNGARVASFGDSRTYIYNGKVVSHSYHLGIDLASVKNAKIRSSNKGIVSFAKFNGIYGNNLIIYHGLGLYSLYGHTSEFLVQKDDTIKRNQIVARTGTTGMALGDHLHFSVLIQGVEVYPREWFDKNWMKLNIFDIIKDARKIIDKK